MSCLSGTSGGVTVELLWSQGGLGGKRLRKALCYKGKHRKSSSCFGRGNGQTETEKQV